MGIKPPNHQVENKFQASVVGTGVTHDAVQLVLLALLILWSRTGIQVSPVPVKGSDHQAR